jgi:hypothetical protein
MRLGTFALLAFASTGALAVPWEAGPVDGSVASRIAPPEGFTRRSAAPGTFAAWLRALPLRPGRPEVRLFDGRRKGNQEAHFAVLAIDVGRRDLQQCADAAIRLRAEYLLSAGRERDLCFRFTSGDAAEWTRWKAGARPKVGREVTWEDDAARADNSYAGFRRWLDTVFTYAGTASLARDLPRVSWREVEAGDVFVEGGFPGHAVIVVDVAEREGERRALLAQSFMPAQDLHLLRRPAEAGDPWFPIDGKGSLVTPEWTFAWSELRRFPDRACPR